MGQKVHPRSFRTGANLLNKWDSVFFASRRVYQDILLKDFHIRKHINKRHFQAQISKIIIERSSGKDLVLTIYAKKPGLIIGKGGVDIEKLKTVIIEINSGGSISINVHEVKKPDLDANIVALNIARQIERRINFKKAMKTALQLAMKQGAKGIKLACSGRLAGAEIARKESYMEGIVPLHTLRANILYATAEAKTTYGIIGVKVWICIKDTSQNKKYLSTKTRDK